MAATKTNGSAVPPPVTARSTKPPTTVVSQRGIPTRKIAVGRRQLFDNNQPTVNATTKGQAVLRSSRPQGPNIAPW